MGYTANMLGSVTKYTKMADKYENVTKKGPIAEYRTTIVVGTWRRFLKKESEYNKCYSY